MADDPTEAGKSQISPKHFIHVLEHLEDILKADLVAWDQESSAQAQRRLDRLTAGLKHALHRFSGAL